jgi:hypothetical protein
MNWSALGAVGELVGGLAVIVSLLYLSVQLRQTKLSLRANIKQAAAALALNSVESIYNSPYMPSILAKHREGESLSAEDTERLLTFIQGQHRLMEGNHFLATSGEVPMEWLEGNRALFGESGWFNSELGRQHWERVRSGFDPEYRQWVDEMMSRHS